MHWHYTLYRILWILNSKITQYESVFLPVQVFFCPSSWQQCISPLAIIGEDFLLLLVVCDFSNFLSLFHTCKIVCFSINCSILQKLHFYNNVKSIGATVFRLLRVIAFKTQGISNYVSIRILAIMWNCVVVLRCQQIRVNCPSILC